MIINNILNRIQNKLSKYTIAQRLLGAFLIQMAIVLLGSSYLVFTSFNNYKIFINHSNETNNYHISKTIEQYMKGMEQATKYPVIFSNMENEPYIYTFLSKQNYNMLEKLKYYQELQNDVQRIFDDYPFLTALKIYELNGEMTLIKSRMAYKNYSYSSLNYYNEIIDKRGSLVVWAESETAADDTKTYNLNAARAIMNIERMRDIGIIVVSVDLKEIQDFFENSKFFPEQTLSIISPEGRVLIGEADQEFLNSNIEKITRNFHQKNINTNNIMTSSILFKNNVYSYTIFHNGYISLIKTPKMLYTYYTLKNQAVVFVMILLLFITMVLLVNIVVKSIVDPLKKLKLHSQRIKDGYFISEVEFIGNDEIAEFTTSFNKMTREINFLVNEVYKKDLIKSKIELQMLVSQINPHFLYNALESIRSKAYLNDQHEISKMISLLGKIIRRSLSSYDKTVKVREELAGVYEYIDLVKYHYEDKIDFIISIDNDILDYDIIILILQPLVENAISHGLAEINSGGIIEIIGYLENDMLVFKVIDNGVGLMAEELARLSLFIEKEDYSLTNIGLRNVNRRIKNMYGNEYGLELNSFKDSGFMVTIKIPIDL